MTQPPPPLYIDTRAALDDWIGHLTRADVIAIDTESDSFFSYREKVCLIQMTAMDTDVIIDPLAIEDLSGLRDILSDPNRVKIFHDAGYDLIGLRRDYGFSLRGLFDTMLASRLLGARRFGLAAVLQERFGFEADKGLQRSDWGRRPLSSAQIEYARYDTHFLPRLKGQLEEELAKTGRLRWALEEFDRLPLAAESASLRPEGIDPNGFWRIKGVKELDPAGVGRARALYKMREEAAQRLNRPPFKVFGDAVLVELAADPPANLRELGPRKGLGSPAVGRFGREILRALEQARPVHDKAPAGSGRRRRMGRFMDPQLRDRYEALRELRRRHAEALGVEPEVLLGNAPLEELARRAPRTLEALQGIDGLNGFRWTILAQDLVALLSRVR